MRYTTEPRDRIYVKAYGVLSLAKNMGKNLSNKYGQKHLDNAKKIYNRSNKTASKRAIQKTPEATGDLIGNKIADKITSVSMELHSEKPLKELQNDKNEEPKKRCIFPKERKQIDNRLLMN